MAVFIFDVQDQGAIELVSEGKTHAPAQSQKSESAPLTPPYATVSVLLQPQAPIDIASPLSKAERQNLRLLSAAICQRLNIALWESHLVSLLGGHVGMTNGDAVALWCLSMILKMTDGGSETNLVDNLAARLKKQLINKMH